MPKHVEGMPIGVKQAFESIKEDVEDSWKKQWLWCPMDDQHSKAKPTFVCLPPPSHCPYILEHLMRSQKDAK